ncbi:efflux RND transporter periplasmic adaptor subunit [Desulfosporosinus sp. PR]|uniref:HlyD family secretion protein n=1 Tax=Candidatus Desulfosporosinus nitrosoreducens TaxID=3401928 RepID=UPI0027FCC279|nr:efflux RND transporter periplasmic adaptor subunit [Desulfosporosinus sp. PR]MDQ7095722.1 efflux RND transporter periplasmic adaptor subunit [Desulfosporosinus sp. PR]
MRKTILICVIAALTLSGCSTTTDSSAKTTAQATTKNSQQSTETQFILGGKVAANEQANVTSKTAGKVAGIAVDVGTEVKQGEVLITLDNKDLQAAADQAEAGVITAKANLNNALNAIRPEQVTEAQAALDSAAKAYDTAKKNYDRIKTLTDAGASSPMELDTASQQLTAANAQLVSAQQQLTMLKNGPTPASIAVYQAQVNQAEAALNVAQAALSNATITAPIDGRVTAKNINVGEYASPGEALVSIANSKDLFVNANAPLEIVSSLSEGLEVEIKISELPEQKFKGKIAVINSKLNDQSRDVMVRINIEDPNELIKPGMFAEIGLSN